MAGRIDVFNMVVGGWPEESLLLSSIYVYQEDGQQQQRDETKMCYGFFGCGWGRVFRLQVPPLIDEHYLIWFIS